MEKQTSTQHSVKKKGDPELVCVECGGSLIETSSDIVCSKCGLVNNRVLVDPAFQIIEQEKGYGQTFVAQANRAYIADDLGSCLGKYNKSFLKDIKGNRLDPETQLNFLRQKKINDVHMQAEGKRKIYNGLSVLNEVISILELPESARDDAAKIYRRCYEQLTGDCYNAELAGGALYLSLRTWSSEVIRLSQLVLAFDNAGVRVRKSKVLQAAAKMRQILGRQIKIVTPQDYIEQILHRLINHELVQDILERKGRKKEIFLLELRKEVHSILKDLITEKRSGRNPYILASAVIVGADVLMSVKRGRKTGTLSQAVIAKVCGIAEFTLREHYLKIIRSLIADRRKELEQVAAQEKMNFPYRVHRLQNKKDEEKKLYYLISRGGISTIYGEKKSNDLSGRIPEQYR
ncbi:MAG: hypothetical protein ACFFBD_03640 [Candidatus Hodarchaeota archaeon]